MSDDARHILTAPVLASADGELDGTDLVLLGLLAGTWASLRDEVATGAALAAAGHDVPVGEVDAAALALRRALRLYAAEDLRAWLAERRLSHAELREALRHRLLARGQHVPDAVAPPTALCAAAFVLGTFAELRERLADRLAAAALLPAAPPARTGARVPPMSESGLDLGDDLGERTARLVRLDAAHRALVDALAADEPRLARRLQEHGLDWVRVSWEELKSEREDAAREAALCVTEDGMGFAEVAALAGAEHTESTALLGELPAARRAGLVAAAAGQLIGPQLEGDTWTLRRVRGREHPSLADGWVRERLVDELLADRLRAGRAALRFVAPL